MTDPAHKDLDDLLAQVAQNQPQVPRDLMARVLIDADQMQPKPGAAPRAGVWAALMDMIGGWPAVGGIAMAGVAGLWIGVAPPNSLETVTSAVLGDAQTVDLFGSDVLSSFSVGLDG